MKERVCCNCRHNIRTGEVGNIECHCDIDGHYIGYVECFEHWCRRWAKDHTFDEEDCAKKNRRYLKCLRT